MAKLQWLAKDKKTLWQTWLYRRWRTALALMLVVAIALTSCGQSPESSRLESSPSVGSVSTAPVPPEIAKLDRYMESFRPKVAIVAPKADQVLQDTQVSVRFDVRDYPLFKDEELGLGPNLHVILDNQPYIAHYDADRPLVFTDLEPGTHTLRVFAARPWHESFKNREAYAQTTFHVFTKTEEYTPQPQLPVLTYSSPSDSYGAEPILMDVWLANAPIRDSLVPDVPKDWRIRYTLNGNSSTLDRWQPLYLTGLKSGRNIVSVELVDGDNRPIRNVFNSAARTIVYRPGGTDTLSQLVRGTLKAEEALSIVGAVPEPELLPEAVIEPVVEPEPESEAVTELEPTPAEPETESEGLETRLEGETVDREAATEAGLDETVEPSAELSEPSETVVAPEPQTVPALPVEEDLPEVKDESELSEPEVERIGEPEVTGESELSQPLPDTADQMLDSEQSDIPVSDREPEMTPEVPASRSKGVRSWWQKLRGEPDRASTLKLDSDGEAADRIPQSLPPSDFTVEEDARTNKESIDVGAPIPKEGELREGASDVNSELQSEETGGEESASTKADTEDTTAEDTTAEDTTAIEETESPKVDAVEVDLEVDLEVEPSDDNASVEGASESGVAGSEPGKDETETSNDDLATPDEAARAKLERPRGFLQRFQRTRQRAPIDNRDLEPTSDGQNRLTAPELEMEEEAIEPSSEMVTSEDEEPPATEQTVEELLKESAQPELKDESAPLLEEETLELESQSEPSAKPQRPRGFLQQFQQKRQELPAPSPNLVPEAGPSTAPSDVAAEMNDKGIRDTDAGSDGESLQVEDITSPPETRETTSSSAEDVEAPQPIQPDRSRGFLQRFQQKRQQPPTTPPNLLSEPDRSSAPNEGLEQIEVTDEPANGVESLKAEDRMSSSEEEMTTSEPMVDDRQPSKTERPRGFLQRFQQDRQPPPAPRPASPEPASVPEEPPELDARPDANKPPSSERTELQPSGEGLVTPAPLASPGESLPPAPVKSERPRSFLQKLRQEQRQSERQSPSLEVPSTLTSDDTKPEMETEKLERSRPKDAPSEDALGDRVEDRSEAQPTEDVTQPEPELPALPTKPERPTGFLQRFQHRNQSSSETSAPVPPASADEVAPTPDTSPEGGDKPTPPADTSVGDRPYSFLEQLKRDREESRSTPQADVVIPKARQPKFNRDTLSSPAETPAQPPASTLLPQSSEGSATSPQDNSPVSPSTPIDAPDFRQKTSRNFNTSPTVDSSTSGEMTTVEKSREPDRAGSHSLLPSSISDQPQRISIPPRL